MKDLAYRDVVTTIPAGHVWIAGDACQVLDKLEIGGHALARVRFSGGIERVVWFLASPHWMGFAGSLFPMSAGDHISVSVTAGPNACDICGHLLDPGEPGRCLNCGNEVPRDPTRPVLDS